MPKLGCFIHTKFTCPECHYTEVKQGAHFDGFDCPKCKLDPYEFEDYMATAHLGSLAYFPREARRAICAKAHFDDFTPLTDRGTHEPVLEP